MHLAPAFETKLLPAIALYLVQERVFRVNTILAISSRAKLGVVVGLDVLFAEVLHVLLLI